MHLNDMEQEIIDQQCRQAKTVGECQSVLGNRCQLYKINPVNQWEEDNEEEGDEAIPLMDATHPTRRMWAPRNAATPTASSSAAPNSNRTDCWAELLMMNMVLMNLNHYSAIIILY